MKERNELARALNDLPDDLLLQAEWAAKPGKTIKFRRFVAAAAIIALLAVTAGAASAGITWTVGKESAGDVAQRFGDLAWDYYKDYDGTQSFDRLEYRVPLGAVELEEDVLRDLETFLRRKWNLSQYAGSADGQTIAPEEQVAFDFGSFISKFLTGDGREITLRSLEDAEELLGIELAVPEKVREAIRSEYEPDYDSVLNLRICSDTTAAQAKDTGGALPPARVVISYDLSFYCTNGWVTGSITIPLTRESARQGLQGLHYSYEKEGAIWQEEQTIGKQDMVFFGNDPEMGYDGWCEAVYIQDGIGYTISARRDRDIPYDSPDWPYYDSAKQIVLSLMEG